MTLIGWFDSKMAGSLHWIIAINHVCISFYQFIRLNYRHKFIKFNYKDQENDEVFMWNVLFNIKKLKIDRKSSQNYFYHQAIFVNFKTKAAIWSNIVPYHILNCFVANFVGNQNVLQFSRFTVVKFVFLYRSGHAKSWLYL